MSAEIAANLVRRVTVFLMLQWGRAQMSAEMTETRSLNIAIRLGFNGAALR